MRYVIAHAGARPVSPAVLEYRERELAQGLGDAATWDRFRGDVEASRESLLSLLRTIRTDRKRVVGYAATSKSTTVTNYCGIGPDLVEFISDTTPIKQGKFSPGTHIPVRPHDDFARDYPEYALLFGWNHAREIMENEQAFRAAGGKWIVYVPDVRVIE
jgi:methylation protein EvaC